MGIDLELQKEIVKKHMADDFPLLKKYDQRTNGIGGGNSMTFSGKYELVGISNGQLWTDKYKFLPHFEFDVGTGYVVECSTDRFNGATFEQGILAKLRNKDGEQIGAVFNDLKDLFYLRNLNINQSLVPIGNSDLFSKIDTWFYFRASSTTYGQLVARMGIDHTDAEQIIKKYLEAVDRRFADYKDLEEHYREKDDSGKVLWEDQNLQSTAYNKKRNKLHRAMFGDLETVLKDGKIDFRTTYPRGLLRLLNWF